jgi:hypothetical protein
MNPERHLAMGARHGSHEAKLAARLVREMIIESHHNLAGEQHKLSLFLGRLERCGFDYELSAFAAAIGPLFQDLLIRAKRN